MSAYIIRRLLLMVPTLFAVMLINFLVVQAVPGFEFQVLDADPRRIKRVRIVRGRPAARRRVTRADTPAEKAATNGK